MLKTVEDIVDRRQGLQLDIRFDFAFDSKGEGFGHILARANERTADRYAVCNNIEERNREFTGRQPNQHTRTTLPGHANALLECDERRRCDQNSMSSTAGRLLYGSCRV